MKCPVCSHDLYEYDVRTFRVDICRDGCSGMWFDKAEFEKCDQHSEPFPKDLLRIRKSPNVVIDRSKTRGCPKCPNTNLGRVVLDPDKRFEIDECASCGGHWVDLGELEYLREEDREMSQIQARMDAYEAKVNEQVQSADAAYRVKTLVRKLFG